MVVKVSGVVVGLVETKGFGQDPNARNYRAPAGRVDFLVPERDTQTVVGIKCDRPDLIRLQDSLNKRIELSVDIIEYDITDDQTGERKQGTSYRLFKGDAK